MHEEIIFSGFAESGEAARQRRQDKRQRNGRARARPSDRGNRVSAVQDEVQHGRMKDRVVAEGLSRGGRSRENEDARTDYRTHTESRETPRPECLLEPLIGSVRSGDEGFDILGAKELGHGRECQPLAGLTRALEAPAPIRPGRGRCVTVSAGP